MEKFKPLEDAKIREIRKLAKDPSLTWTQIGDIVGVSPKTARKYGEQARRDADEQNDAQETPTARVEIVPPQVEDDPEVFAARKRLLLAELDLATKKLQLTSALEDRVTELEGLVSGNDEDGLPKMATGRMVSEVYLGKDLENLETRVAALESNTPKDFSSMILKHENHLRQMEQRHSWLLGG